MKKKLAITTALLLFFVAQSFALPDGSLPTLNPFSGPVAGETDLIQPGTGKIVHVDWIVVAAADMPDLTGLTLEFAPGSGGQAGFNISEYFYFYQMESASDDIVTTLHLDVEPSYINSVGYMAGVDLDTSPFVHDVTAYANLAGESESMTGSVVDPDLSIFVQGGASPHVEWFYTSGIELAPGNESSVLFLTSDYGPRYNMASIMGGSVSYDGYLPTPPFPDQIPEPLSMTLLGMTILGLFIRKRVK